MELAVASGLKVLTTMLEEDRTAICGPRYQHQAARQASRTGTVPSEVVLGGRKVAIRRPRVRANGAEVPLPTFQLMASEDPLNRRVVEQMLVGVATRQYARSLEPLPSTMATRGREQECREPPIRREDRGAARRLAIHALDALDLVALLIDGVHIGEHCIVVALGIDHTGAQTRARSLGRVDRECGRVSEPLGRSPEPRPADRSQPLGHPRWLEGAAQSGDPDVWIGGVDSPLPRPQAPQHPGASARGAASVGPCDRRPRLQADRGRDRATSCCRIWRDDLRIAIRVRRRASAKDSTRRSPSSHSASLIAFGSRSPPPTRLRV